MDNDYNNEPSLLPFPLDRIARASPEADVATSPDGEGPSILLFAQPDRPHEQPAA